MKIQEMLNFAEWEHIQYLLDDLTGTIPILERYYISKNFPKPRVAKKIAGRTAKRRPTRLLASQPNRNIVQAQANQQQNLMRQQSQVINKLQQALNTTASPNTIKPVRSTQQSQTGLQVENCY